MDIFTQVVEQIIKAQEGIIGPVALEQAKKVSGLNVNWPKHEIVIEGNKASVVDNLIKQYETLFGKASIEVCKDASKHLLKDFPKDQVPALLQ